MDETIEFDARDFSFACLGLANQLPFALDMVRAQQLRAAGSETEAKDRLLDIVARCYQDGYLAGEYACHINLAELAISVGNLDEALVSIDRLCVIRDSAPGGPWIRGGRKADGCALLLRKASYQSDGSELLRPINFEEDLGEN
ncbi:hypothetical protein FOFC_00095 [Fusarium oxysporum]|nr:hypothetical protein FOFC_00095 [Fusarium oxysporum]